MLWHAGQKRSVREERGRLAELYVGVRDGYLAGLVASGQAKARHSGGPSYLRDAEAEPQTVQDYRATLARLGALFPGSVKQSH
jgi:hypothetical protein